MNQALGIGLNGVNLAITHQDKLVDPLSRRYKKMRGQGPQRDPDLYDRRTMEEKGLVLRRRRDVGSDEEIIETVRHRGQVLPRRPARPGQQRRSSSMNNARALGAAGAGAGAGALVANDYHQRRDRDRDSHYDSEGSVPPRSRVRAKSSSGRSRRKRGSSSSSSSSLLSSTEEEKSIKKMQRKKWITAALASVATIHAASKVYSSIESHDKRVEKVLQGEMSPEEAHKQQRSARWQDAAAIGIAALGIKGAVSEWNEVSEEHSQHKELMEQKEEHHRRRLERERRTRAQKQTGYYKGRDGQWYYNGRDPQSSESYRGGSSRAGGRYDDSLAIRESNRARDAVDDAGGDYDDTRSRRSKSRRAVSHSRGSDY